MLLVEWIVTTIVSDPEFTLIPLFVLVGAILVPAICVSIYARSSGAGQPPKGP